MADFKSEQSRIDREQNTLTSLKPYPLMKLEDMYFHEIGVKQNLEVQSISSIGSRMVGLGA